MLGAVRGFGRFWLDFIVGDDWRVATGIGLVLAVGAVLVERDVVRVAALAVGVPIVVVALFAVSILIDARRLRRR
jgi:hypothetical protein